MKNQQELKRYLTLLSDLLIEVGKRTLKKTASLLVVLSGKLWFQIKFLIRFNYSRANIEEHLSEKAMSFFGYYPDLQKKEVKRKANELIKKIHKKGSNASRQIQSNWGQNRTVRGNNGRLHYKNSYQPSLA